MEEWLSRTAACSPVVAREIFDGLECLPTQLAQIVVEYVSKVINDREVCANIQSATLLPLRVANLVSEFSHTLFLDSPPANAILRKGIDIVTQAVRLDTAGGLEADQERVDWQQVLDLYTRGVQYLVTGAKYIKNERAKAAVKQKICQYLERAEIIKGIVPTFPATVNNFENFNPENVTHNPPSMSSSSMSSSSMSSSDIYSNNDMPFFSHTEQADWDKIFGVQSVKEALVESFVLPLKFSHLFRGRPGPDSVLLYGVTGTGKSYLAKGLQTMLQKLDTPAQFLAVSGADVFPRESEYRNVIRNLFKMCRPPCVLFIDDIDAMVDQQIGQSWMTEFFIQMQSRPNGVVVLAATAAPWKLSPAHLRRFDKKIQVSLPDMIARRQMLCEFVPPVHSLSTNDFDTLANQTNNYSGAEMSLLVRDAAMASARKIYNATYFRKVHASLNLSPRSSQAATQLSSKLPAKEVTEQTSTTELRIHLDETLTSTKQEDDVSKNLPPQKHRKIEPGLHLKDNFLWAACESGDDGAQPMSMMDVAPHLLYMPLLALEDFRTVTLDLKEDSARIERWSRTYDD